MERSLPRLVGLGLLVLLTACPGTQPPPDTEPPAVPTGIAAEPGDGQVTLGWTANLEPDLERYNVYRGTTSGSLSKLAEVLAGTETYTDTGLANGTTYFYALGAEDEAGNASERSEEVAATPEAEGNAPPQVVSSTPADGEADVARNAAISLAFSRAMNEAATQAALRLEPPVDCGFTWNQASTTLTCQPGTELAANTGYTVTLATEALDAAGNPLEEAYSFSFITGDEIDTTAPTVSETDPADGDSGVALNDELSVSFSEAMNRESVEAAFASDPAIACDFAWNFFSTTLTCRPQSNLRANTTYSVTIGTGAEDASGNPLEGPFSFSFTTGATELQTCVFGDPGSTFGNCVFGP